MALINCPECQKQVSSMAASCPSCGMSIANRAEAAKAGAQLTTIQETSKKFKVHTLLSVSMLIIGIVWVIGSASAAAPGETASPVPMLLITAGLIWYIANRFRIWWHHK